MSFAISGQVTVTTAGTAVSGPSIKGTTFEIRAKAGNAGLVYLGPGNDDGDDVTSANGHEMSAGDRVIVTTTDSASFFKFDAANDGDGFTILRIDR